MEENFKYIEDKINKLSFRIIALEEKQKNLFDVLCQHFSYLITHTRSKKKREILYDIKELLHIGI